MHITPLALPFAPFWTSYCLVAHFLLRAFVRSLPFIRCRQEAEFIWGRATHFIVNGARYTRADASTAVTTESSAGSTGTGTGASSVAVNGGVPASASAWHADMETIVAMFEAVSGTDVEQRLGCRMSTCVSPWHI